MLALLCKPSSYVTRHTQCTCSATESGHLPASKLLTFDITLSLCILQAGLSAACGPDKFHRRNLVGLPEEVRREG